MLDMIAVTDDGPVPLYLHTVYRILRNMRIKQQETRTSFDYKEFKLQVTDSGMIPTQLAPLTQRLDTLESFMPEGQTQSQTNSGRKGKRLTSGEMGNDWTSKVCLEADLGTLANILSPATLQ